MTVKCALELIVGAHWHCSAIVPVTVAVSAIHRSAASCRAERGQQNEATSNADAMDLSEDSCNSC